MIRSSQFWGLESLRSGQPQRAVHFEALMLHGRTGDRRGNRHARALRQPAEACQLSRPQSERPATGARTGSPWTDHQARTGRAPGACWWRRHGRQRGCQVRCAPSSSACALGASARGQRVAAWCRHRLGGDHDHRNIWSRDLRLGLKLQTAHATSTSGARRLPCALVTLAS